jgi:plasmid stabilization system protein ParE
MDKYRVIVTNKAQSDIAECVSFVKRVSKESAYKLADELYFSFGSLEFFPEKNPIFPTPKAFPYVLRKQVVNNRYIVLYTIEEQKVVIYRVLDVRRSLEQLL